MNRYKPGQSVHLTVTATQLGAGLVNPPAVTCTVHEPGGRTFTPAVTNDSTGAYHADFGIPIDAVPDVWVYRWQTTGGSPNQNALVEKTFAVAALEF